MPLFLAVFVFHTAFASLPPSKLSRLDHFGKIKLGDSIIDFPSIRQDRAFFRAQKHSAHFFMYLFKSGMPQHCYNLQCGRFATRVLAKGGVILGGADSSYLSDVGFEPKYKEESVLFVTNPSDHITAIYKNVSEEDFGTLLENIN